MLFLSLTMLSCGSIVSSNKKKGLNMKTITFIPKEFNNIQLGYNEDCETLCSPEYPNGLRKLNINTIAINVPKKIICVGNEDDYMPVIPICIAYIISDLRGLKYAHLSAKMAHIKKVNEDGEFLGEIYNKNMDNEYPAPSSYPEEAQNNRLKKMAEVQNYSDEELNKGQAGGGFFNLNLMEYIDMPFVAGFYEICVTHYGLESNRAIVEIIIE